MNRYSIAVVLLLLAPVAVLGATETPPDPFAVAPCLIARVPEFGEDAKYLNKVVRSPYSLELPFHAVLDETRAPLADHNAENPDAEVNALLVGHGGYLFETGLPYQMAETEFFLILDSWFARGVQPTLGCIDLRRIERPQTQIMIDPYTGNVFVCELDETTFDVVAIALGGEPVARIRLDLISAVPLADRTGSPYGDLDSEEGGGGFFWFDLEPLAPFVGTYRRTGGEEYARFVADALLARCLQYWAGPFPVASGMRLPYLPPAVDPPSGDPAAALRLDGLRTSPYEFFVTDKPRKGGVLGSLAPVLKLLEARDCPETGNDPPQTGSCPAYSVMALQTELTRTVPQDDEHPGHTLSDVFDVVAQRGVCQEYLYPMPEGKALGWSWELDEFARRAEKALNRILRRADADDPIAARFRESVGERRIEFVDALPPLCAEDMNRYVERHDLVGSDLVELYAVQHDFGRALPGTDTETLHEAQQAELLHLTLRLLDDGVPVVMLGDRGALDHHSVVAHGRTEAGVVVMDGRVEDEAARRRTVIPFADLREALVVIAFLRGELEARGPTEVQLRRSLEYVPDDSWAHYLLGRVLRSAGNHREASVALRRAVELDPEDPYAHRDLGSSLSKIARFDEALEAFDNAIDLGFDTAYCHGERGYALRRLGRLEEAGVAFRRALDLDPKRSWAARQLGWALHGAGDDREAEKWFRKALDLTADDLGVRLEFAEFLACADGNDEARLLLVDAAEIATTASELRRIGAALVYHGSPEAGSMVLERAIAMEDGYGADSRLSLARAHLARGDADSLRAVLEPLAERLTSLGAAGDIDFGGWIDLAFARALLGKKEACSESVEAFVRSRPEPDGDDFYDLACIHALNGDPDLALEALDRAFEMGFQDYHWVTHDSDMAGIAEDPRFGELLDRYAPHQR